MIRRPASTLQLSPDDVSELIKELEEQKLQRKIQAQRVNLKQALVSENELPTLNNMQTEVDSSFQRSPLNNKRLPVTYDNIAGVQEIPENSIRNNNNNNNNPFYHHES
ncbi:hypothetical protein NCAS_0E01790 [Naumovozyma castellii]|uniref:Uncharacterized protein n=1 Tax=Naumovozyma castellii TaxID=27288 RepID=G0VFI3_NAUCA|nr:hypothetical protein NCAS_0E01790 [Naumovozyma castellii CBS 4309]CCC70249.1 hypothetical protein NCAS_0E01790 [Naumovozyma castellii CBS 4309]